MLKPSHHIALHRRMATFELDEMRRYAILVTSLITKEAKAHEAHVGATIASMDADEREAYLESNSDDYEELVRRFPNHQQISLLTLSYSVVESRLVAIARTILQREKIGLLLKDLAGDSPLQKARKCIGKVGKHTIDEKRWDALEPFRLVRNILVHNAGQLPDEPPPLVRQLLAKSSNIHSSSTDEILLEPAFIEDFLSTAELLYSSVFDAWLAASAASSAP